MTDAVAEADPMDLQTASPEQQEQAAKDGETSPAKASASTPRARRARKQVEFFTPDPIGADTDKLVVREVSSGCVQDSGIGFVTRPPRLSHSIDWPVQGKGTKLGEIPNGRRVVVEYCWEPLI